MELYLCSLDEESSQLLRDDFNWEMLLRNMSLKDRSKVLKVKNEKDRFVKALNTVIVQYVLHRRFDTTEIKLERGSHGKPRDSSNTYGFNLSDEVGIVALGLNLNSSEVGLDLANPADIKRFGISPTDFYRNDFSDIFGEAETQWIDSTFLNLKDEDEMYDLISKYWALKESYSKYLGLGITHGLSQYEFTQNVPVQCFNTPQNSTSSTNNNFQYLGTVKLHKIEGYKPNNCVLYFPSYNLICSVFAHFNEIKIYSVNLKQLINFYIDK